MYICQIHRSVASAVTIVCVRVCLGVRLWGLVVCLSTAEAFGHPVLTWLVAQTHFVSAVTYGAEAYLLFELECSTVEQKSRMQGALKAALAGVDVGAAVDAHAGAEFEMERSRVRVRFHGDVRVPMTVTTMEDALTLLQVWRRVGCAIVRLVLLVRRRLSP